MRKILKTRQTKKKKITARKINNKHKMESFIIPRDKNRKKKLNYCVFYLLFGIN